MNLQLTLRLQTIKTDWWPVAGIDVVVRFAGRSTSWVLEGAVRWSVNGNDCNLNDTGSVCDLS